MPEIKVPINPSDPAEKYIVQAFGTGDIVPGGAIYLCTMSAADFDRKPKIWHYFLIEKK